MMGVLSKSDFGGTWIARAAVEAQNEDVAAPWTSQQVWMFSSAENVLLRSFFVNV
jgi:hypothetical protein